MVEGGEPLGVSLCSTCEIKRLPEEEQKLAFEIREMINQQPDKKAKYGQELVQLALMGKINAYQADALVDCVRRNVQKKCR